MKNHPLLNAHTSLVLLELTRKQRGDPQAKMREGQRNKIMNGQTEKGSG